MPASTLVGLGTPGTDPAMEQTDRAPAKAGRMVFRSMINTILSQLEKEKAGRGNYTWARQALVQLEAPGFLLGAPWRNTHGRAGIA